MKRVLTLLALVVCVSLAACGTGSSSLTWQEQYDLGMRYLSEGNYEEAIIAFTAAIEIDSKHPEAFIGRGDAYIGSGDTEDNLSAAQADYEAAIALDGTISDAWLGLGDVYIRRGQYDQALDVLQDFLSKIGENQNVATKIAEIVELEQPQITDAVYQSINGIYIHMVENDYDSTFYELCNYREFLDAEALKLQVALTGLIFDGDRFYNKFSGVGLYIADQLNSLSFYYGEIENGLPNGSGVGIALGDWQGQYPSYQLFEGEWKNGLPNGSGIYTSKGGHYEGGRPGEGGIDTKYIEIISGSFCNGHFDGLMTEQTFEYDKLICLSTIRYDDGTVILDDRWLYREDLDDYFSVNELYPDDPSSGRMNYSSGSRYTWGAYPFDMWNPGAWDEIRTSW